jgi:hypothetical protein
MRSGAGSSTEFVGAAVGSALLALLALVGCSGSCYHMQHFSLQLCSFPEEECCRGACYHVAQAPHTASNLADMKRHRSILGVTSLDRRVSPSWKEPLPASWKRGQAWHFRRRRTSKGYDSKATPAIVPLHFVATTVAMRAPFPRPA